MTSPTLFKKLIASNKILSSKELNQHDVSRSGLVDWKDRSCKERLGCFGVNLGAQGELRSPPLSSFDSLKCFQEFETGTRAEFLQNCKAGKYDNVVAIFRSNASTSVKIQCHVGYGI
jgi:hypothetical protein